MASTSEAPGSTARALLDAALVEFGQHGFDGVTIRQLADAAGTNLSSIKYHFGGKDELYAAALDEIIAVMGPRVALVSDLARRGRELADRDRHRQAQLVRQLCQLDVLAAGVQVGRDAGQAKAPREPGSYLSTGSP